MICPACGRPTQPAWKFCPYCGEKLPISDNISSEQTINMNKRPTLRARKQRPANNPIWRRIVFVVILAAIGYGTFTLWQGQHNQNEPANQFVAQQSTQPKVYGQTPFSREKYKEALSGFFAKTYKFQFIKNSAPNSFGQITSMNILRDEKGQQIELKIIEKDTLLDSVVLSIWLNRNNTINNPDLKYILYLLDTMYPGDKPSNKDIFTKGIASALNGKEYNTSRGEAQFRFIGVQNAGGTTGENAIILEVNKSN